MAKLFLIEGGAALDSSDDEDLTLTPEGASDEEDFFFDENEENLVETFEASERGQEILKAIAEEALDNFERDYEGSEEYRQLSTDNWALFSGELPEKDWPYEDCANGNVPVLLQNISRLSFRMTSELFGDWHNILSVLPVGPDDRPIADILTQHVNWQFSEQITDFPMQMERGVLCNLIIGDTTCHSYYSPGSRTNCHDILTPDDFVTPYVHVAVKPDYSDTPHYTKILRYYRHDVQAMVGKWFNIDKILEKEAPGWDEEPEAKLSSFNNKHAGKEEPSDASGSPYVLLQYEGWTDLLPNQEQDRFIQVVVDKHTRTVVHLCVYEEEDWQDKLRAEREQQELDVFREQQVQASELAMQAQMMGSMLEIPQPPPPDWMFNPDDPEEAPAPPRKVPVRLFTHLQCIQNLSGALGLSVGRVEADLNRAINVMTNQFIDQASLGNSKTLITTDLVEFTRPLRIAPGAVNRVSGIGGGDLKNNMMPLDFGPGNPQLAQMVDKFYNYAESVAQAPAVMSGGEGKSGETFRGISARIEQATKQISVITRKQGLFVQEIAKNNAKLNARFLPDDEIIYVTDHLANEIKGLRIGRAMYERDYRTKIVADLRYATQAQRIQEADEVLQMPTAVPALQSNPLFQYQATVKALQARGLHDMIPFLGAPPPPSPAFGIPPMPPAGMAPPGMPPVGAPPGQDPAAGPPAGGSPMNG